MAAMSPDMMRGISVNLEASPSCLPQNDEDLRYAASMPDHYDHEAPRPFCGNMWKRRQLFGFLQGVILLCICYFWRFIPYYEKANEMLGILLLCACFWLFEVVPVYVTALVPMVLIPCFKITSADVIISTYWDKVSMLFLGTFLVDVAQEQVGLPRRIALYMLLKVGGRKPSVLLAVLMGVTWFLSMLLNSIATALMICPLVVCLMNAVEDSEHESSSTEDTVDESEYVPRGTRSLQHVADGFMLGTSYAATCGGIATLIGTPPNLILAGAPIVNGTISFFDWFQYALPLSLALVIIAYVILALRYTSHNKVIIAKHLLEEEYERLVNEVGPFSRDEILVGIVQIVLVIVLFLRQPIGEQFSENPRGVDLMNGGCLAVAAGLVLFFIPSKVNRGQAILTWRDAQEKVQWGWLLMLGGGRALGAGFAESGLDIAVGQVFGDLLGGNHPYVYSFVVTTVTAVAAHILTPLIAAAVMFPIFACASMVAVTNPLEFLLPAAVACSFSFALPFASAPNIVAFAKSRNLYRHLRTRDFASNGMLLLMAAIALNTFLSWHLGKLTFDVGRPYPKWACEDNAAAACTWMSVPGVVQGHEVQSQACIYQDETDDTMCRIWNGTSLPALNESDLRRW